ncbi:hypothetical protein EVG20_g821 [Dentipellis fragilis]|uniref:Uncharacterized protein n=1 Tax=Dentipellis fragilis TaxID=205917 RepID=A0A4Y9ZEI7_9AGAM|nr:hypothetical protein EVG20_g821 [Dentipellis fragilis]
MPPLEQPPQSWEAFRPSTPHIFARHAYAERIQGPASIGDRHNGQTQHGQTVLAEPDSHADADDEFEDEPAHYTTGPNVCSSTSSHPPAPPSFPSPNQEYGHREQGSIAPPLLSEEAANTPDRTALWAQTTSKISAGPSSGIEIAPNLPPAEIGSDAHYYAHPVYPANPEAQSSLFRLPIRPSNYRKRKAISPPPFDQDEAQDDVHGKGKKKQKLVEEEKEERAERARRRRSGKAIWLDKMRGLMDDPQVFDLSENEVLERAYMYMANLKKEKAEGHKREVHCTALLKTVQRQLDHTTAKLSWALALIKKITAFRREGTDGAK